MIRDLLGYLTTLWATMPLPWRRRYPEPSTPWRYDYTTPVTISGMNAALKETYLPEMRRQLYDAPTDWSWVWRTVERYETELYVEYEGGVFVDDDGDVVPGLHPVARSRQVPVYAEPSTPPPGTLISYDPDCPPNTIYGIDPAAMMHEPWSLDA